jgi:type IV secretory pathway VirB10-like protein
MSAPSPPAQPQPPSKIPAESLLAAPRWPITRYRPAVIAGLLLVGAGFAIAFGGGHRGRPSGPAGETERAAAPPTPDLKGAPTSYADAAKPDLAPGVLSLADGAGALEAPPATGVAGAAPQATESPAVQHAAEQARSARETGPFFGAPTPDPGVRLPPDTTPAPAATPAGPAAALSAKRQFIASAHIDEDYAAGSEQAPRSPYEVKAGAVISAALLTGLNADLPGEVVAQVTEPVFDHATGRVILIPQGARLIGQYDSQAIYGQNRLLLVWNRVIFPDGRSINIGAMTGVDRTGASGLSDRVDSHLPALLRAVGLASFITIGGAIAQDTVARSNGNIVLEDGAGALSQSATQVGGRLVDRDLARQPTLQVRPGFRVDVLVSRDLVLEPYGLPR